MHIQKALYINSITCRFKAKGTPKKQKQVDKHSLETDTDEAEDKDRVSDLSEEPSTSNRDDNMKSGNYFTSITLYVTLVYILEFSVNQTRYT